MGRTKLPRGSASSRVLSEEKLRVLEQAALILNQPVEKLLSGSSGAMSDATGLTQSASPGNLDIDGKHVSTLYSAQLPSSFVVLLAFQGRNLLLVIDTHDEMPSSPSPPPASEDSDDIVQDWQTSAAEFRHIDEDIPEPYFDFNCWVEDPLQPRPPRPQAIPIGAAIGFIEPASSTSTSPEFYFPQQPTQGFGAPHPASRPQNFSARHTQNQMTARQTQEPSDWTVLSYPGGHQQLGEATEVGKEDELQIIAVDPLQRPAQPRQQRRKAYDDPERQEDTGKTRSLKACVRCRMQKIRVSVIPHAVAIQHAKASDR